MTTNQDKLADWLAQEDEQYQEYVKQRERRRIEWQSALDAARARAERAEARAKRWEYAAECARQLLIASARSERNTIEGEAEAWFRKFNDAFTTAADESEGA